MLQFNVGNRSLVITPRPLDRNGGPGTPDEGWARKKPVAWSDRLATRAEAVHEKVKGRNIEQSAFFVDDLHVGEAAVLSLHGDLSSRSVPQLEAILDGLVILRPARLIVDLSGVAHVSGDALNALLWHAITNTGVVLRSPDPGTHLEIQRRGHARWVEAERLVQRGGLPC
jgi:hypothetical protein